MGGWACLLQGEWTRGRQQAVPQPRAQAARDGDLSDGWLGSPARRGSTAGRLRRGMVLGEGGEIGTKPEMSLKI